MRSWAKSSLTGFRYEQQCLSALRQTGGFVHPQSFHGTRRSGQMQILWTEGPRPVFLDTYNYSHRPRGSSSAEHDFARNQGAAVVGWSAHCGSASLEVCAAGQNMNTPALSF